MLSFLHQAIKASCLGGTLTTRTVFVTSTIPFNSQSMSSLRFKLRASLHLIVNSTHSLDLSTYPHFLHFSDMADSLVNFLTVYPLLCMVLRMLWASNDTVFTMVDFSS